MKIVAARPPNYDEVVARFPVASRPGTLFAHGDTIYSPSGPSVSPELIAHEEVHATQQSMCVGGVAVWWARYLSEPRFRFDQEVPAHQAEYAWLCTNHDARGSRKTRRFWLSRLAKRLSGPLYGGLVTFAEARRLIKSTPVYAAC
jgi:hypothetical protein